MEVVPPRRPEAPDAVECGRDEGEILAQRVLPEAPHTAQVLEPGDAGARQRGVRRQMLGEAVAGPDGGAAPDQRIAKPELVGGIVERVHPPLSGFVEVTACNLVAGARIGQNSAK